MKPKYECSSRGDKRFSAFYAKVDGNSIEYIYQVKIKGYNSISEGKGKPGKLYDFETQKKLYKDLWREYLQANPTYKSDLLQIIKTHDLNDMFATKGGLNQADILTEILNEEKFKLF